MSTTKDHHQPLRLFRICNQYSKYHILIISIITINFKNITLKTFKTSSWKERSNPWLSSGRTDYLLIPKKARMLLQLFILSLKLLRQLPLNLLTIWTVFLIPYVSVISKASMTFCRGMVLFLICCLRTSWFNYPTFDGYISINIHI